MKYSIAHAHDGSVLFCCLFILHLFAPSASAHKPTYTEGEHSAMEDAFPVVDPDMSIVLYHPVECDSQFLWLGVNLSEARPLYVQLGVPQIERLEDYRPILAIVAQGLPAPRMELPFALPEGYGARVFDTASVDSPSEFFEPFTGTASWILHESTENLPAGVGYVVAWPPSGQTGKLWVAVGDVEKFKAEDFENAAFWLEATQTFHETGNYVPEIPPVETICEPEPALEVEAPSPNTSEATDTSLRSTMELNDAGSCTLLSRPKTSPLGLFCVLATLTLLAGLRRQDRVPRRP